MNNFNKKNDPKIKIEKIYIKNISFEVPIGYEIFKNKWAPGLDIKLKTKANSLDGVNLYEIIIFINTYVKSDNKDAFKIEIEQAGIFYIDNKSKIRDMKYLQHVICPNILYPYAREAISNIVLKSGFPQLCIAPFNFNLLYEKQFKE